MFEQYGGFFVVADRGPVAEKDFYPVTAESLAVFFPARIEAVSAALPTPSHLSRRAQMRAIVSVAHQGWMARLVSPALAARVHGIDGGLSWRPDATSFFALALDPSGVGMPRVLREFTEHVAATYGVSRHVLHGNTASAMNSAARMIATDDAYVSAQCLLRDLELPATIGPYFHRDSCCLIYQFSESSHKQSALCGDCVLRAKG